MLSCCILLTHARSGVRKMFPTGQMDTIILEFWLLSVLWGMAHFQGLLGYIPLCSLMLAKGSLPLTTSLISFVSWFFRLQFSSRHWDMCDFHKWNSLFWPSSLLQNYLQLERGGGHRGLMTPVVLSQPMLTCLLSKTEPVPCAPYLWIDQENRGTSTHGFLRDCTDD